MGFTSTNSCCCFDLKTGGLIIGYLSLIFWVFLFFTNPFSYGVFFTLLLLTAIGSWLYGIHENNYLYMLPYLIWTVIEITIVWIAFFIVTISAVFGLGMIDTIYQYTISESSLKFDIEMMQVNVNSPDFDDALAAGKSLAGGFIFVFWLIDAIITAIWCYLTVVIISLYKKMKAESFGQQPLTPNSDFEVSLIYPHVPQMCSFEAIEITK